MYFLLSSLWYDSADVCVLAPTERPTPLPAYNKLEWNPLISLLSFFLFYNKVYIQLRMTR